MLQKVCLTRRILLVFGASGMLADDQAARLLRGVNQRAHVLAEDAAVLAQDRGIRIALLHLGRIHRQVVGEELVAVDGSREVSHGLL